ncbi:MAG: SMEK domain-containing protein [Vulcanibacillus sp.]
MLDKESCLKDIADILALLSKQVEIYNCVSFYDINIIVEDFYAEMLNLIFGYNLVNLNVVEKNATAIDLGDMKNRLSIQVTSDNSSEKIKDTIRKFIKNELYLKYDRLVILMLIKKKKYTTSFNTENRFAFDSTNDIIDYTDLMKNIRGKETIELKRIRDLVFSEFADKIQEVKKTQSSEVYTIIALIEYITKNRELKKKLDAVVDPEYKINKRFKEFTERIVSEYITLLTVYGDALNVVNDTLDIDEAQELITILYLQDISIKYLDETNNDPIEALNRLVSYFEEKMSENGIKYDRAAIKFYLVNEMIKCNVFPNERGEYNDNK